MFNITHEEMAEVQEYLDKEFPSPKEQIVEIGSIFAMLEDVEETITIRRLIMDLDDLILQSRWYLGHSILILKKYPHIKDTGSDDNPLVKGRGMPSSVHLLLREYIVDSERVMFTDLTESWRGGTVAGWIYNSLIDSALYRILAALDRIAHVLWTLAGLKKENIYFRSRKLEKIHAKIQMKETNELLDIAKSPLYEFLLSYRDGFSHNKKFYSRIAGYPPEDIYTDSEGNRVSVNNISLDAEYLLALGNAAYSNLNLVMSYFSNICNGYMLPFRRKDYV
ncbi:hypothetical protein [Cohnella algarum]|uniref:hypothetical protein n=1 Tax=Cohnella algarum TaxID=2044859 RepID=UPI0019685A23|nr:hypothetical protein [Cohnella algarum]MBN2981573.1 hypothetical protein [Cohnella algarum]